jgi:hypothetical protein
VHIGLQKTVSSPPTPSPNPHASSDFTDGIWPFSSSQIETASSSEFQEDPRAEDVTHIFIKAYPLTDGRVGKRLVEMIMMAKRAKDLGVLRIGHWKLSHSALSALEVS